MRTPWCLLSCALIAACPSESPPEPDPQQALAKLEEIEARLIQLETDLKDVPTAPTPTPSTPRPSLGQMTIDYLDEGPAAGPNRLSIEVTPTGYRVDGARVPADELAQRIRTLVSEHDDASLVVRVTENVDYREVVKLLDLAKDNGVRRLAIASPSSSPAGDTSP